MSKNWKNKGNNTTESATDSSLVDSQAQTEQNQAETEEDVVVDTIEAPVEAPAVVQSAPQAADITDFVPPEIKKAVAQDAHAEQALSFHDAARRFIINFKEHHLASIVAFAKSQGISEPATVSDCKALFTHWGAKLK